MQSSPEFVRDCPAAGDRQVGLVASFATGFMAVIGATGTVGRAGRTSAKDLRVFAGPVCPAEAGPIMLQEPAHG